MEKLKNLMHVYHVLISVSLFSLIILGSCSDEPNPTDYSNKTYSINGSIQKGPFISGSSIKIQELNGSLEPLGTVYETTTKDDFGHYNPGNELNSQFVEVIASGFYFDEVLGSLSQANLTLRAIADLSLNDTVNVNVLTTLTVNRINYLMSNNQMTFGEARELAETEILNIFNISDSTLTNFVEMDISLEGNHNAALLSSSAILQGTNTVAELSELLSKISQDIETDGSLNNQIYINEILNNANQLSLMSVRQNLESRYYDLGLDLAVPNFEDYVDLVWNNNPPICTITSPHNNANFTVGENIIINVNASDNDGEIFRVEFYIDSVLVSTDNNSPFNYYWNTAGLELREYQIIAVAIDDDNKKTSKEISVNIESINPICQITYPQNGAHFTKENSITISATASDSDGSIISVSFFIDNNLVNTDLNNPYEYVWDLSDASYGMHNIKVVAKDTNDKESLDEIYITIDYIPPTCQITSPSNNSSFNKLSNIEITAEATDADGHITLVDFFVDDELEHSDQEAPYAFTWNPANTIAGEHTVKATARDNNDQTTESQISINIEAIAPNCVITSQPGDSTFIAGDNISFNVDATDTDGIIQSVKFFVNNILKATDEQAPYEYTWNTTGTVGGSYTVKAIAEDDDNQFAQDEVKLSFVGSTTLISPVSGTITSNISPVFQWQQNTLASSSTFALSTNVDLSNPILTEEGITSSNYNIQSSLPQTPSEKYYWGVFAVDVDGKSGPLSTIWNFTLDTEAPTGYVIINNNDERTSSETINLNISATDYNNVTQMYISKNGTFTDGSWENYTTSKQITYSEYANTDFATLTVHIKFKDSVGNESDSFTDSIELRRKFVSGTIWSNVTWFKDDTPHIITGDVQVPEGVTLTIEPGVEIKYPSSKQILIKGGSIFADGNSGNYIMFSQSQSDSNNTMIMFEGTNLSNSLLNYVKMSDAFRAIQVGNESEHNQAPIKNSGILTVSNFEINNTEIRTDGYDTQASVVLNYGIINNSRIFGEYPRSEPIEINNSTITNSNITSDAYNEGIIINSTNVNNTEFRIGCCGGNIKVYSSTITNSSFIEGNGSPVRGPLEFHNSNLSGTSINLPAAECKFENCTITNSAGIKIGNGLISFSNISGTNSGHGLEITGKNGYDIRGLLSINHCDINNFDTGIYISDCDTVLIGNTNMTNNTYNIYNDSNKEIDAVNNYWGTADENVIKQKIFDYYDDLNKGKVIYTPFKTTIIVH